MKFLKQMLCNHYYKYGGLVITFEHNNTQETGFVGECQKCGKRSYHIESIMDFGPKTLTITGIDMPYNQK